MAKTEPLPMKDAAERILQDAGGPMRSTDITAKAIERGLIKTKGKTPEATMAAQLAVDVQSKDSRFVRTVPGAYGLRGRDRKGQKPKEPDAS